MAVAEKTLLEFLMDLLSNHDALADFRHDPEAALQHAGLGDCSVQDIKELLPVVLEKVDAEKCAQYEDDCDDDKCYDSEPKHHDDNHHCKPVDCDDDGRPAPHCSPIEQSIAHLNYVTNNYNFVDNSHNTYNETNNITKIWAGDDADINVHNSTTNVGDHGSFIGGDANAPVVTGDHSFVGDGNQVASGDGSTTAFGAGSALSHVGTGDGGAISVNGPATATNSFGDGSQAAAPGGTNAQANTTDSGNTHADSHNTDNSGSHNITDSQNHTTDSHDTDSSDSNNVTSHETHNALVDASHAAVDVHLPDFVA